MNLRSSSAARRAACHVSKRSANTPYVASHGCASNNTAIKPWLEHLLCVQQIIAVAEQPLFSLRQTPPV
jgi:hypothetical protein